MLAEAGADGVVEDVVDGAGQLLLGLDDAAGEAVAPQVSPAAVRAVEALRVDAVQALHPEGELLAGAFDDEVVVVAHQAERLHRPATALDDLEEDPEELAAVVVRQEDEALLDAPRGDVEVAVREERPKLPRHSATVPPRAPRSGAVTESARNRHAPATRDRSRAANCRVRPWFSLVREQRQ
ncbi:MAG TPA: hypothetical protein VM290_10385 [Gaiellaceae bacterium]|jgi:hypothetical protein|nr:hypothetical protein [Gaiellaceae bacterium]